MKCKQKKLRTSGQIEIINRICYSLKKLMCKNAIKVETLGVRGKIRAKSWRIFGEFEPKTWQIWR